MALVRWLLFSLGIVVGMALSACTQRPAVTPLSAEQLVESGRKAYVKHCIACHHADPKIDGALGPAVFGSSRELLERRIVHGDYPQGYTPKRPTRSMVAMPHVKSDIEALHAYLNKGGG
jgi:mono/diheme cytochrome c family protein